MNSNKNVLITGASGLVGNRLTQLLLEKKYKVSHLVRKKSGRKDVDEYLWNPYKGEIDEFALTNAHAVIHLAGAGIADKPWTEERKKEIINSRVNSSKLLVETIKASTNKPVTVISASAVGYYGLTPRALPLKETDVPGNGFLSECCIKWEEAVSEVKDSVDNFSVLRIGVVLTEKGGALPKIAMPVKWGVGSPLGSGKQIVSWIHIDDLCNMFIYCMENKLSGIFNAVAPEISTNTDLTKIVAGSLKRPVFLPNVPGIIIKLLFGELSSLVLEGAAVSADKISSVGFKFQHNNLKSAINEIAPRL